MRVQVAARKVLSYLADQLSPNKFHTYRYTEREIERQTETEEEERRRREKRRREKRKEKIEEEDQERMREWDRVINKRGLETFLFFFFPFSTLCVLRLALRENAEFEWVAASEPLFMLQCWHAVSTVSCKCPKNKPEPNLRHITWFDRHLNQMIAAVADPSCNFSMFLTNSIIASDLNFKIPNSEPLIRI